MEAILVILLGVVAVIGAGVLGVGSWIALKLFKNELNLKITINNAPSDKESGSTKPKKPSN